VKIADAMAQTLGLREERCNNIITIRAELDKVIEQQQCFSLKDLAVNGRDLMDIGIPRGVILGKVLNHLLDSVINEVVENDKSKLTEIAKEFSSVL